MEQIIDFYSISTLVLKTILLCKNIITNLIIEQTIDFGGYRAGDSRVKTTKYNRVCWVKSM